MKIIKCFIFVSLVFGITLMVRAGNRLIKTNQIYKEGNEAYEDLTYRVRNKAQVDLHSQSDITKIPVIECERIYIPDIGIDFETLNQINKDAVAWLYCPETEIDYPVMKADDYGYYLNRLPDGTINANGSLFIDYNNPSDFSGELTVIYGHSMKSGKMFGSLNKYKSQEYYEKHPFIYLYTEQSDYRIDLMYGCVIDAGQWRDKAFMYSDNIKTLLDYSLKNTTFTSMTSYKEGNRIIALSTCSYEFNDARYLVIGLLSR